MKQTDVVIKNARKDACGFELDDGWYSSFNALKPAPNRGDTVSFDYKEKEVNGRTYKNIIEKTFSIGGTNGGVTSGGVKAATGYSGRPNVGFPIPTDHGNRAINRQSAIAQAVNVMAQVHTETNLAKLYKADTYLDELISVARAIESYTTGDMDSEMVQKLLDDAAKTVED